MSERLDVVIFGASGFTGKHCVLEAVKVLENLQWGIAGRNKEKLQKILMEMGKKANTDLSNVPIIIADVENEESLANMAARAKVVVNCCGPYRHYGESVVKACIEGGAHHVDVSGEPYFMELMQLKYNELAEQRGVYVVSACGFDSIPIDVGLTYLEKNFNGVLNSVESYVTWDVESEHAKGPSIHFATYESAVYGLANADQLRGLRSKLFKERLPRFKPKLEPRPMFHKSDITNGYCVHFLGADKSVVRRSQHFLYTTEMKRPVQVETYLNIGSLSSCILLMFFATVFGILSKFSLGRKLLLNYPGFFSFGMISHEGPSEEKQNATKFFVYLKGNGWDNKEALAEPTDQYTDEPKKNILVRVSGKNPGYGATCIAVLTAAKVILNESNIMPGSGGVLPPGAAFAKTNLVDELQKYNGMKFEILNQE